MKRLLKSIFLLVAVFVYCMPAQIVRGKTVGNVAYIDKADPVTQKHYAIVWGPTSKNNTTAEIVTNVSMYIGNSTYASLPVITIRSSAFINCYYLTTVSFPSKLTHILDNAFANCVRLKKVNIVSGLISIGDMAFSNCYQLDTVLLPNTNTLETIGNNAFKDCIRLKYINIPVYVSSIGQSAFLNCESLSEIGIPYTVTHIGVTAFKNCKGLKSAIISTKVYSIGVGAFQNCRSLETVEFHNKQNMGIRAETFDSCVSLKKVTIVNDNIVYIDSCAFRGCRSLPEITIPATVKKGIGASAFEGCTALDAVTSLIEEPYAFGKDAFKNISPSCVLTVPYGKRAAYIAAGWTEDVFKGGVVELPAPEGIHGVRVKPCKASAYYDLEGKEVSRPQKGKIYIRDGKKVLMK